MPIDRTYTVGDRVIFLGRKDRNIQSLHNYGPHQYTVESLTRLPFVLIEGIVTEVARATNGPAGHRHNRIYVNYMPMPDDRWTQDFTLAIKDYARLSTGYIQGTQRLGWLADKIEWTKQFIYPFVVTSAGYNRLLMDLHKSVMPPGAMLQHTFSDMAAIQRRAEDYGIEISTMPDDAKTIGWAAADAVERAQDEVLFKIPKVAARAVANADVQWGNPIMFNQVEAADLADDNNNNDYHDDDDDN